jgi:hypothetical protein
VLSLYWIFNEVWNLKFKTGNWIWFKYFKLEIEKKIEKTYQRYWADSPPAAQPTDSARPNFPFPPPPRLRTRWRRGPVIQSLARGPPCRNRVCRVGPVCQPPCHRNRALSLRSRWRLGPSLQRHLPPTYRRGLLRAVLSAHTSSRPMRLLTNRLMEVVRTQSCPWPPCSLARPRERTPRTPHITARTPEIPQPNPHRMPKSALLVVGRSHPLVPQSADRCPVPCAYITRGIPLSPRTQKERDRIKLRHCPACASISGHGIGSWGLSMQRSTRPWSLRWRLSTGTTSIARRSSSTAVAPPYAVVRDYGCATHGKLSFPRLAFISSSCSVVRLRK